MKKKFTGIIIIVCMLKFTACDSFLDVYPTDRLIEEQVLNSELAINSMLNGIYMSMASSSLYGATLTWTVVEALAQRWNLSNPSHPFRNFGTYSYEEREVQAAFERIWTQMFAQILTVNEFIGIVHRANVPIPEERRNILLGEAHALRAFLHFDLLRLFGPIPSLADPNDLVMPYNNRRTEEVLPLLPANQILDSILADLYKAEEFLRNDPIITDGIVRATTADPLHNFFLNRNYRMNFYAVKALQARVWLWAGNKPRALEAARAVIEAPLVAAGRLFYWLPQERILTPFNPDRVFSTEVIFGLDNRNMYVDYNRFFSPTLLRSVEFAPFDERLRATFNNDGNDFRFHTTWLEAGGDKDYRTFFKFAPPSTHTTFRYFQPLIRISELYYIIAESEPDPAVGLMYLNSVRRHRGLMDLTDPALLRSAIREEYAREFWGEGQLFFYFKRNNVLFIPDGNTMSGYREINPESYRLPIPLSELRTR